MSAVMVLQNYIGGGNIPSREVIFYVGTSGCHKDYVLLY